MSVINCWLCELGSGDACDLWVEVPSMKECVKQPMERTINPWITSIIRTRPANNRKKTHNSVGLVWQFRTLSWPHSAGRALAGCSLVRQQAAVWNTSSRVPRVRGGTRHQGVRRISAVGHKWSSSGCDTVAWLRKIFSQYERSLKY